MQKSWRGVSWVALAAGSLALGRVTAAWADGGGSASGTSAGGTSASVGSVSATSTSGAATSGASTSGTASSVSPSSSSQAPGTPASGPTSSPAPIPYTPVPGAATLSTLGAAPPFGTAVRLGNVGTLLQQVSPVGAGGLPTPFLSIVPSIGASETYVTGGYGGRGSSGEFITSINPALLINGATRRTTFTLDYNPSVQFYAGSGSSSRIEQALDGALDVTLIPQMLNVEARAYATEQSTAGGLPPGGSSVFNNNNATLTQSYALTPTFNDAFRYGTLNLLYSAQYTKQSGRPAYLPGASLPYFAGNNLFAQTVAGSFTTIPFFHRFDDVPSFSATEDVGNGVLRGAHQYFVSNTLRYALIPHVVLSGSVGYEDIAYGGVPPTLIKDATWSVGVQIVFPDGGLLVARYQHLYGFNSPYFRLVYALTQRTTLAASYTELLSTEQQGIGLGVASSGVNSIGLPIGGLSGQPVLLSNQSLSVQSGLTRNKELSASLITHYTYDTLSLSLLAYQDTLVATARGQSGFSQKSASISVSDSHRLSNRMNALFYLSYGRINSPALNRATTSTYGVSAALTYRVTPSLYANAQYSLTNNSYTGFGNSGVQNIFTVGIQKTF